MNALDATRQAASASEPHPRRVLQPAIVQRSSKILDLHLDRLAIVYVRQSDPQQVLNHRESRERQYALADHAVALGWPRDRVLVIDDDQGQSGRTADQRGGFHRLLAEVTMEHVGLILGIEMSRIARNNKDWHNLLEMCAIFGTILADEDGVYDPQDTNDRLLLGLKGTISEFELVTMRNRLERGRLHKAQRGELFHRVPTGYVKLSTERVELDPDEQVREVIRLIFDKYDETRHRLGRLPLPGPQQHPSSGSARSTGPTAGTWSGGARSWRPSSRSCDTRSTPGPTPTAAGRTSASGRPTGERTGAGNWVPMEQWKVLKRDRLPAYITWERYLANQESPAAAPFRSRAARGAPATAPRCSPAWWSAATAAVASRRLIGRGTGPITVASGTSTRGRNRPVSASRPPSVDDLVAQQVLRALEPAALELSCRALEDVQRDRARLDKHWKQRLERARYEAEDAERRYRAVDPENRLVARTLEQRWEEALRAERQVRDDYDRFLREQPPQLAPEERARIAALSSDLPALVA